MTYLDAIILGIIEGVTEFLPVSSTGHLILASYILDIPSSDFHKSFEIIIQLGAITAVVLLFWRSFLSSATCLRLLVGFIPTAILGFTLYPLIKGYLHENLTVIVIALALGGVILIAFELFFRVTPEDNTEEVISLRQAATIGLFQSFAFIPGVSRSAATIIGGLMLGLKRTTIVEFSFLLAVPTMTAATGYDIYKNFAVFTADTIPVLVVGFLTAFGVAIIVIKTLLKYIKKHTFIPFGVYRLALALIFFLFFL
jgi:undecaprenyl-diphosphatase